uniref:Origin recognition complex subunit 3 N-terminal domain-containing protein n=1 Tax=Plectus sambesii TaxID=2011161 RepID=A0A914WSB1_9BILA
MTARPPARPTNRIEIETNVTGERSVVAKQREKREARAMNLEGCSFRFGDRPKPKKGRLSLRSHFSKSFAVATSTDLASKSSTTQEEKKWQAELVDIRRDLYLKNWEEISEEVAQCAERVFDEVLTELISFVDEAASINENNAYGNLSAATVQFGASDDDKFFGDVENRLRARCPVVRLRAETCKTAHKCIQQIINGFFTKISDEYVDCPDSNVFQRDKKEIGEYLTKTFKMYLRSPDSVPMHECLFPTLTDSFRSRSMAAPNKCLDQTLLCPEMVFKYRWEHNGQQHDIATAFQSFQKLAAESKSVSMAAWSAAFVKSAELRAIDEEEQLTRFYKCVGELELIGCLKAASERNLMSAHKLYWTSEVISGFGAAHN